MTMKTPTSPPGRLLLLGMLLCAVPPVQAQTLRTQHLDSPAVVVETGAFRLVASVGTPALGAPVVLQQARHRALAAEAPLETAEDLPTSFSLEANYPNPFNPATTIQFALPEATAVRLAVYDLLGRQVHLLVDEQRPAGRHEVVVEARGRSSGVYFDRIEAGSFPTVRQMLLVK